MTYASLPASDILILISDNNFSEVYKNLTLLQYSSLTFIFYNNANFNYEESFVTSQLSLLCFFPFYKPDYLELKKQGRDGP